MKNKENERIPIVGMSYKNYINTSDTAEVLISKIILDIKSLSDIETFVFPSMGTIETVAKCCKGTNLGFGVQNMAPVKNGAYTGEFSIESLKYLGGKYVELGHFERKNIFFETDEQINDKIKLAIDNDIVPVVCVGEAQKCESNELRSMLAEQISRYFYGIRIEQMSNVIIAYEPGWAIGKEESASADYIHKAHSILRSIVKELFSVQTSKKIRIIYGGSVSITNSEAIIDSDDVDGLFVGRFGHRPDDFIEIVKNVHRLKGG